jgi:hypothetical protein
VEGSGHDKMSQNLLRLSEKTSETSKMGLTWLIQYSDCPRPERLEFNSQQVQGMSASPPLC